jgi:hypothetical protein
MTHHEATERAHKIWGPRMVVKVYPRGVTPGDWFVDLKHDSRMHALDADGHVDCPLHHTCLDLEKGADFKALEIPSPANVYDGLVRRDINAHAMFWAVEPDIVKLNGNVEHVVGMEFQNNFDIVRRTLYIAPEQAEELAEQLKVAAAKARDARGG